MNELEINFNENLNKLFVNEDTLDKISDFLDSINDYKKNLDIKLIEELRELKNKDEDLQLIDKDIKEIILKIKHIKDKTREEQEKIYKNTEKIEKLDFYKKNLVSSITILKKLQMLTIANENLKSIIPKREYINILNVLSVVKLFLEFFKDYKTIEEINQFNSVIHNIENKIVDDVFFDFEMNFDRNLTFSPHKIESIERNTSSIENLRYGCEIIYHIDPENKNKLLKWFYNNQLKEVLNELQNTEVFLAKNFLTKYSQFKDILKKIQLEYLNYFPETWRVDLEISKFFCESVNHYLKKLLDMDVKLGDFNEILQILQKSNEFENFLNESFKTDYFSQKKISFFESHTHIWLNEQNKIFYEKLLEFNYKTHLPDQLNLSMLENDFIELLCKNSVPNISVLSIELFELFYDILAKTLKFSNGKVLIDLFDLCLNYLTIFYDKNLSNLIPKNIKDLNDNLNTLKYFSMMINTSDYIIKNVKDIHDKISHLIIPEYSNKLESCESINEIYYQLINITIHNLLIKFSIDLKQFKIQFVNNNWNSNKLLDDVSGYVIYVKKVLTVNLKILFSLIIREKYVRNICDKLVELLLFTILNNLESCNTINDLNKKYLLNDLYNLQDFTLTFLSFTSSFYSESDINTNTKPSSAKSKSYEKFVNNHFEKLFKIIDFTFMSFNSHDDLVSKYLDMIEDNTTQSFQKMLKLKRIKVPEQKKYLDIFKSKTTEISEKKFTKSYLLSIIKDNSDDKDLYESVISKIVNPNASSLKKKSSNYNMIFDQKAINETNKANTLNFDFQNNKLNENFKNISNFFKKNKKNSIS